MFCAAAGTQRPACSTVEGRGEYTTRRGPTRAVPVVADSRPPGQPPWPRSPQYRDAAADPIDRIREEPVRHLADRVRIPRLGTAKGEDGPEALGLRGGHRLAVDTRAPDVAWDSPGQTTLCRRGP